MDAIKLIKAERNRQLLDEKYSIEHDDLHVDGELANAAACYAIPRNQRSVNEDGTPLRWPWDSLYWKPSPKNRIRELVKAGALIVAEIERIQRISKYVSEYAETKSRKLDSIESSENK